MFKQMTIALAAVALVCGWCLQSGSDQLHWRIQRAGARAECAVDREQRRGDAGRRHDLGRLGPTAARHAADTPMIPKRALFLDSARMNRDSAWAAWQRGDTAAARAFRRAAFSRCALGRGRAVPERARADRRSGRHGRYAHREFPGRSRRTANSGHTRPRQDLLAQAVAALAAGDKVTALALNLRGIQILHRLVEHVRYADHDHDDVADREMEDVGS